MTRRELRVLACLAARPGLGLLSVEPTRAWLQVRHGSTLDDRVPLTIVDKLIGRGHIAPTADPHHYAATEAGVAATLAALLPRLRDAWSKRRDMGPLDAAAFPIEHAFGTAEEREMTDTFLNMGWLDVLAGRESLRFTPGAKRAMGMDPHAGPSVEEQIAIRRAEQAARRQAIDASNHEARRIADTLDAEKEVLRLARAAFRQEATFDELEAAVRRLEELSPDAEPGTVPPSP